MVTEKSYRSPLSPGGIHQDARRRGDSAGRFDETRAQESPTILIPVRSSVAGRELRHHFAWIKYFTSYGNGGPMAAGYPVHHGPKIINSAPPLNRNRIRPTMSSYPKPATQGGMATPPRFVKVLKAKQFSVQPQAY